jgi:regulatory protein
MFKPYLSKEIALEKIKKYCAYQERTHKEVREKLKSIQCHYREIDEIIVALIEEDFLNEERFAITYARGKFRMKSWGKQKIKYALKMKGISEYCIKKGLAQIPEEEYLCTLKHLFQKNTEKYK